MSRAALQKILSKADVKLNGSRPWDIQVFDDRFYSRVLSDGSLGIGESYMEGWWESPKIDEMVCRVLRAKVDEELFSLSLIFHSLKAKIFNLQDKIQSFQNAGYHYNVGNDLYEKMLDSKMIYSCGYWKQAKNLNEAQEYKLELVCKKLDLKPGNSLLDIGCGWGGLAEYAAKKYQVKVTGITVSKKQFELAKKRCAKLPVKIFLKDYRDLNQKFDRIVSVGMFEHVGYKNYSEYMKVAHRCLKEDGLFLLHTIGRNSSTTHLDPWMHRYIFPNAMLPSIRQIGEAIENLFMMEDWHNFGPDYDKTLVAWFHNFHQNWKELEPKYGRRFYQMWKLYLLTCAGGFRAREMQLWQILLSKGKAAVSWLR